MRRMDRYEGEEEVNNDKISRSNKNQELYKNVGSNARYTNFTDVTNTNAYDISNIDRNNRTRENYKKVREYSSLIPGPKVKRELEEFKNVNKIKENRVYDINSVMAEARKNRVDADEKEEKRKLKNDKYNILLSMTKEELEEYRKMRKEKYTHPDEEELRDAIDTIASKTLAGEIDKNTTVNLLSELMATSMMDKVESQQEKNDEDKSEDINDELELEDIDNDLETENVEEPKEEDKEDIEEIVEEEIEEDYDDDGQDKSFLTDEKIDSEKLKQLKEELDKEESSINEDGTDSDFYTKSMKFKEKDFEGEMDEEFKEKGIPVGVKLLLFIILFVVCAVAAYFIWKMI